MKIDRNRRALVYLLLASAILGPASSAFAPGTGPALFGAFVVLVAAWGSNEGLSVRGGIVLAFIMAVAGPAMWAAMNVLFFAFVYLRTALFVVVSPLRDVPEVREVLPFLRSEFAKAVVQNVLPYISPRALLGTLQIAIPAALGGALAAMLTQSTLAVPARRALDYVLLWKNEREWDDFDRIGASHPEVIERARELRIRGFDEQEARRLAVAEFNDPVITPKKPPTTHTLRR